MAMRKWMELLMEAGLINAAEQPLVMHYVAEDGSQATFRLNTATGLLADALDEAGATQPMVRKWFETVFLNYVKRHGSNMPGQMGISVGWEPIDHYIHEYAADMIWDNTHPSVRPSRERYGSGHREDPKDHIIVDDMLASLPEWARDGWVIVFFQFAGEPPAEALIDYLTAMAEDGQRIDRMSVPDALRLSEEWHEHHIHTAGNDVDGVDIKPVMRYQDGYRMVQILTPKGLDRESMACHHCIGRGGYDRALTSGEMRVYSLRDAENMPHATMAVNAQSNIIQLKGHQNGPVTSALHQHLKDFILAAGFRLNTDHDSIGLARLDQQKRA